MKVLRLLTSSLLSALLAAPGLAVVGPNQLTSGELAIEIEKLQFLGSVLYVAAHPDDENTSLLTYLSRGQLARTAYLSITRGDGGQNLIGTELGDLLGLIRTQELLEARHRDGAEQRFTRAIDFGYTKSVDEALEVWGREEVLSDVVRVVRTFQPDVMVMRFPGDGRGGHGQHVASAVLAMEAFDAAADPNRYPEQLRGEDALAPWQPKRLLWDAARFFGGGQMASEGVTVDTGQYSPLLGQSFTEISAASRSMHKSQGFGASSQRGSRENLLEHRLGDEAKGDLFDGVDTTWARVGGAEVGRLLAEASTAFDHGRPSASVPKLLEARRALAGLQPSVWVQHKRAALDRVILAAAGVWLEATADAPTASPGDTLGLRLRAINRSTVPVDLRRAIFPLGAPEISKPIAGLGEGGALPPNEAWETTLETEIPADQPTTQPYWLGRPPAGALFDVANPRDIGQPETFPLQTMVTLDVAGEEIDVELPLLHRWTERVEGERYRTFNVVPRVDVEIEGAVRIFASAEPQEVAVHVRGTDAGAEGSISLELPRGWRAELSDVEGAAGGPQTARFQVFPPASASAPGAQLAGAARAIVQTGGTSYRSRTVEIDYPHIPVQTVQREAAARVVRVELEKVGQRIGYVMGAGDRVPEALRQIGYEVTLLSDEDLASGDLGAYDALVLGIRAYNARPAVQVNQHRLLAYVEGGGTMVTQYNTISRRNRAATSYGPYPFRVSRDRVSVEEAPVTFTDPDHPLLTTPNRITQADFDGWVQERGLYFPNDWDERYSAPLASNDPGEPARQGGLLYAEYGKGVYIYTGYSFFRELPAGVPGAYRLFVNLLSARQR